jgi:hypothetical protein
MFAVLLALQNFQNLQSAYNQKNACLATIPAASTAPAAGGAATTPARRDLAFAAAPYYFPIVCIPSHSNAFLLSDWSLTLMMVAW